MKSFEDIYKELEYLFIEKLPEYIEKENEKHNDGIVLKTFTNKNLIEECIKLPYFIFSIEDSEYTEKDRVIENTIFNVLIEIKTEIFNRDVVVFYSRYFEAVKQMFIESELSEEIIEIKINKVYENKIGFQIVLN